MIYEDLLRHFIKEHHTSGQQTHKDAQTHESSGLSMIGKN